MELSDLTPEEDVVLLGLLREVVTADGKYTDAERRGIDRVRAALGEARFDKAMNDAQSRYAQQGALKEAAKGVTRQSARAAIFAVLSDVAADDGMAQEEMKPLNWLASWWDLARSRLSSPRVVPMTRSSKVFAFGSLFLLAALGGCDCGGGTTHHGGDGGGPDLGGPTDGGGVDHGPDFDGGDPDLGVDMGIDRVAFCMGMGPAVVVGDTTTGTMTCAGSIASRVFNNSVCSCTDTNIVGYLVTRSFDSGSGMMDTTAGAPVGVDQTYTTGGYADVGGTFVESGSAGVMFGGYVKVAGDAKFNGPLAAIGYINVSRDLYVNGNVTLIGATSVGRDLHQPSGRTFLTFPDVSGSTDHTPFTIDPPCDCNPGDIVDVAGIVDDAHMHNDNADVGLADTALEGVAGIGRTITLPCGRFYLTAITGLGDITVHLTGRTALFVEGDVDALGVFDIDLDPGAELDLFIKGNLASIGAGSYGDRSAPARSRIYVGGSGDVVLVGASGFVGNVYAPHALITAIGATTVYGSLFGGRIDMPGYLNVHYDRAILDVDRSCPPPPGCDMCGGDGCVDHTACIAGACAPCTMDSDCCPPLVCYPATGTCGPLLI